MSNSSAKRSAFISIGWANPSRSAFQKPRRTKQFALGSIRLTHTLSTARPLNW